ncbi:DUF1254 domain-containing protein [Rhodopseudomonas sp. P1]|uniref:DUF1254 domain-containing protein n=1 Tax=Rhodopseudomonas sp. P1 TaxID=3434357 RepID=UPI0031FDA799
MIGWLKAMSAAATAALLLMTAPARSEPAPVSDEEALSLGIDAYLYFYPLVTMDLTRKQSTNVEAGKEFGKGPMNSFVSVPAYPPADFKTIVRPNFDTLYSIAWLDLAREPIVVTAPDTNGRYYLLPMLDMWTDVFASPGWRTTGTQAQKFLVTAPGWSGAVPAGLQRIEAPTPIIWIIGRTKTDGPADYAAVHQIQAGYTATPLSQWGKPPGPAPAFLPDPAIDMKTPPKQQVDSMPAGQFFAYAAELLKQNPPHITDQPIIARLRRIGLEPGKSFDLDKAAPNVRKALGAAPAEALKLMSWKMPTMARVTNGWSMNIDTMGVYGNYYLKRAIVAQFGLGANVPEDAIYPVNIADETSKPLDGTSNYVLRFQKGATPPVDAFWSLTLYDSDGFPVPNALQRQALSSWMPLKPNADGSLDLVIQNANPGTERESNWLPAPKGPFTLTMRMYAPKQEALTGRWAPPPVTRVQPPTPLGQQ